MGQGIVGIWGMAGDFARGNFGRDLGTEEDDGYGLTSGARWSASGRGSARAREGLTRGSA